MESPVVSSAPVGRSVPAVVPFSPFALPLPFSSRAGRGEDDWDGSASEGCGSACSATSDFARRGSGNLFVRDFPRFDFDFIFHQSEAARSKDHEFSFHFHIWMASGTHI